MSLLNYVEFGQGDRDIIILHGLFGSSRNWQGIARSLANSHRVITPDLRNHGQSPHFNDMSYIEMAKDLMSLIDHLKLKNIILIGHSMGGKVTMTTGLLNPDRFNALINVDIAPVNYSHNFSQFIEAMKLLDLANIKSRNSAEAELSNKINDNSVIQLLLQNLVRTEEGFNWRINLESIATNMESILKFPIELTNHQCRIPTLFIGGADSNYLRNIYNNEIFQLFPAAEIKMIEGTGHWLHAEKPTEFLKEINDFINCV